MVVGRMQGVLRLEWPLVDDHRDINPTPLSSGHGDFDFIGRLNDNQISIYLFERTGPDLKGNPTWNTLGRGEDGGVLLGSVVAKREGISTRKYIIPMYAFPNLIRNW